LGLKYKLEDAVDFNPIERLTKGTIAKKVPMEKVQAYSKDIKGFDLEPYNGGAKFRNGDTIMARITPCLENGKSAFISFLDDDEVGYGSTEFIVWRAKKGISDSEYIYYLSQSPDIKDVAIKSMVGSSGRQRVQQGVLDTYEIDLPPLSEQKHIAAVLSALDEKIAVNNKINHNLEQTARAVFKSWFVDFEPWGGVVPEDWKEGMVGDYCLIKSGFAFKSSWWQENGIKVIKIKNITDCGFNFSDCSFVSEDKVPLAKDFTVVCGDLLIAMTGATIGKFAIIPQNYETLLVNQRVGKFFLGDNPLDRLPFLWCLLKQEEVYNEIVNRGQGSAQPNISPTDIMTISTITPSENILSEFNSNQRACFEIITANEAENQMLTEIRDSLLPRLISGELRVDGY
jgi:type I restriction enzyme S subunit